MYLPLLFLFKPFGCWNWQFSTCLRDLLKVAPQSPSHLFQFMEYIMSWLALSFIHDKKIIMLKWKRGDTQCTQPIEKQRATNPTHISLEEIKERWSYKSRSLGEIEQHWLKAQEKYQRIGHFSKPRHYEFHAPKRWTYCNSQ